MGGEGGREREREGVSVRGIEKDRTSEDNWRLEKEMINRLRREEIGCANGMKIFRSKI